MRKMRGLQRAVDLSLTAITFLAIAALAAL
jgi:hypothetical protein